MQPVPVAENLLETKLFGFSLKRLMQSIFPTIAPGMITAVLNFPITITGPLIIVGSVLGLAVYKKTPRGQSPIDYLKGTAEHRFGTRQLTWKPVQTKDHTVTLQEGNSTRESMRPQDILPDNSLFGSDNTVENVDFQAVRDDGVIETEERLALIIDVQARPWLILDEPNRDSVYRAYRQFLMGIDSKVVTFTLPRRYDPEEYLENVANNPQERGEESPLLSYGRALHQNWVENVVDNGSIKDRDHYLVVTASKMSMDETAGGGSGLPISGFGFGGDEEVDEEEQYEALWSRARNAVNMLPKTGVSAEIMDNREDVLKVLYYYYNRTEPPEGGSSPEYISEGDVRQARKQSQQGGGQNDILS